MSPNQSESDAMAAFLACRSGNISLEERARLWAGEVERIQKEMAVKEFNRRLDGKNQNNQA